MRIRNALCVVSLLVGMAPQAATQPSTINFSSTEFTEWSSERVRQPTGENQFTATRETAGGNPGAFWHTTYSYFGEGNIAVAHSFAGAVHDPKTDGPIGSIDWSVDLIHINSHDDLRMVAYRLMVVQDGNIYNASNLIATSRQWTSFSQEDLGANHFVLLIGDGPIHPDFTSNGSPIQFGVITANTSNTVRTVERDHGMDNFSLTIHPTVEECLYPPNRLIGWWPGDGNAHDIAAAHHGTLAGDAAYGTGRVAGAFTFGGAGEVVIEHSDDFHLDQFSFDAWVYPTSYGEDVEVIASRETDGGDMVQFATGIRGTEVVEPDSGVPVGNLVFMLGGIEGLPQEYRGWTDAGAQVPLDRWTHVALTFGGSTARTYVNGSRTRTIADLTGAMPRIEADLKIGARSDAVSAAVPASMFNGIIDEVELFDVSLGAGLILQMYTSGASGKCRIFTVNTASGSFEVAPESIVSGFAPRLSETTEATFSLPLPAELGEIAITIIDSEGAEHSGRFFFVSASQANFYVVGDVAVGPALVVARRGGMVIALGSASIENVAPGIFTANADGKGAPAASWRRFRGFEETGNGVVFDAGALAGLRDPVQLDLGGNDEVLFVTLFATGMRRAQSIRATLGGEEVPVTDVFALPDFVGLDQINVGPIPRRFIGRGIVELIVYLDGKPSNIVSLWF
jgi:uncharacterized protein (TIGR03437 family)